MLYLVLWGSNLYFNGTITDPEGDEIPIYELLHHFLTSPWWRELGRSCWDTLQVARNQGWAEVWKMAIELLDPLGEQNAYTVSLVLYLMTPLPNPLPYLHPSYLGDARKFPKFYIYI